MERVQHWIRGMWQYTMKTFAKKVGNGGGTRFDPMDLAIEDVLIEGMN